MATLQLKVQYFQDSTPKEVPCREENFVVRELEFALPVEQTALVLVDLWNVHHIDSWIERAEAVTKEVIAPLIERAREGGLTIVQAPSPGVLANFPDKYEVYRGCTPEPEQGPVRIGRRSSSATDRERTPVSADRATKSRALVPIGRA